MKSDKKFKREQFLFYANYYKSLRNLPVEVRAEVYDAICYVSFFGCEPENGLSSEAEDAFCLIRPGLYTSLRSYNSRMSTIKKSKNVSKHGVGLDGIKSDKASEGVAESAPESITEEDSDNRKESIKEGVSDEHTENYPDLGAGQIIPAPYGYGFTDLDDNSDLPF